MASYRLSKAARADLRRIYRYGTRNFGPDKANEYHDAMFSSFSRIAFEPYLYVAVDELRAGYRRAVYGAHSIYYRLTDDGVEIMRVLGRQNPDDRLKARG